MNYKPIIVGNQSNGSVGKARVETVPDKDYILLPLWTLDLLFSSSSKDSPGDGFKPSREEEKKADEGLFVGYSTNSKAFKVLNSRTRIVEENPHVKFRNQSNGSTGKARVETVPDKDYILLPLWTLDLLFSSSSKDSPDDGFKPSGEEEKKDTKDLRNEESEASITKEPRVNQEKDNVNSINRVNAVNSTINAASNEVIIIGRKLSIELPDDPDMHDLEDICIFEDLNEDIHSVEQIIRDIHSVEQIIGDTHSAPQTRRMTKSVTNHDSSWIKAMQDELLQFKLQQVLTLMDLPYSKRAIRTKWIYRNKKDKRGIVIRNKVRLVTQGYTQEEGIDYDEVFAPVARIKAIRLFLAYASFKDFVVYQMDVKSAFLYGKIDEEVYVYQPLRFEDPEFLNRVYKVEKALYGLHQAPRAWYETLSTYLLDNVFQRDVHNLVAFLSKPTESEGFKQIIDFLNANRIIYALTMNPFIYTSCIEQLWVTAKAKNINGKAQIHAKVDGKKVIIYETIIRRDLKFENKGGGDCLLNEFIFEQLPLMGMSKHNAIYVIPSHTKKVFSNMRRVRKDFSGRDTLLFPTMLVPAHEEKLDKALNDENVPAQSNDLPLLRVNTLRSGEDRLKLQDLMELCTKLSERVLDLETTKTTQAKEILSLKRRVKILEKKKKSRTHGLKRLYKIGLFARERYDDQEMFDTDVLNDEEVVVEDIIAAITTVVSINDITLAQELVEIKTSKPKERDQISFDEQEARRLQAEIDEQDRLAKEKEKAQLIEDENLSWDNVQDMMDADYELATRLHEEEQEELTIEEKSRLFVELMNKRKKHFAKLKAEDSKRAGDNLDKGRSKKQKVEDDKEQEELKRWLKIIPDDGDDVTIDVTPLSIDIC
uniref:Putative reverse transcriptase, RNA-dependent DNA polymerase n=1 Tax=Tanacetum cinerariifolium TaxID=118510 RepID=A0A699HRX8_TANCI|nr:putative reverse transcriptase, RNA-dependent DNA polymerase [Tanacetum cinerariifolium]